MTVTADTAFGTDITAGSWTIDPSHSEVGFTVRHLMSKVRGQFTKFEGKLTTGDSLESTRATATIDLNSIDTRDEQRDGHLRSGDFFDVENSGQMTFTTTSFDGTTAAGELTIKGITKPVQATGTWTAPAPDAFGSTRGHLNLEAQIDRSEWDMNWNAPLPSGGKALANEVTLIVEISLVEQA
jgi:polyisoprenoid-binding protein YceI